jgi:hypothetical protein
MGRGIQPFRLSDDGDTLFAVSTAEGKAPEISDEDLGNLGSRASETAWDAILASVPVLPVATPRTNVRLSSATLDSIAGHLFAPDAIAELRHKGDTLEIELTGRRTRDYLSAGHPLMLNSVPTDESEMVGPAGIWFRGRGRFRPCDGKFHEWGPNTRGTRTKPKIRKTSNQPPSRQPL